MEKLTMNNAGFFPSLLLSILLLAAVCYSPIAKAGEIPTNLPQANHSEQLAYYGWHHHRHHRHFHHRCHKRCYINRWGHRHCYRRC